MFSIAVTLAALALSVPPAPPAPDTPIRADALCLGAAPTAGDSTAEVLTEQAARALAAQDPAGAERLSRRALEAEGGDVARARAARILIDLRMARGDLDEMERILACRALGGEAWTHARAWLAYRQGRYDDAVALLAPLARPRHHMQPRWSIVHEDLGDAYARLGRRADAQAQWLIALATDYDPGGTGWDRGALERKIAAAFAADPGAEPMLPLQRYGDAVSILDLRSVERTPAGVRYAKLVLLQNDESGTAYGIDGWEVDCAAPRSRVLGVHRFDASGGTVRRTEDPLPWLDDRPGDPWLPTERRLVCSLDGEVAIAPRRKSDAEMLRAYRSGAPIFE